MHIITGLLMGVIFGIALEKGRVFEPGMIVGQFQLRNFTMLKMFLSAIATTLVVIGILHAIGLVHLYPKATLYPATILGGLTFGAGMALAGACPGTVFAQIGAGYRDAWAVAAGALLGAIAYGYAAPILSRLSSGPGKITLADVAGLPFLALALAVAVAIVIALFVLEKWRPWRNDLGRDYDGCFPNAKP
jgi:uncharacterized membrane protein YedE/YeeE